MKWARQAVRRESVAGTVDAKRTVDLVVSFGALIVAAPVMAIIAALIRADSKGPALFRQERVGMNGRHFRIHKFRTLRADAGGPLISPTHDNRVTRVGAVLRRTKLDELPQLIDVIAGHMSLVGPRPEVPKYVAMWPPSQRDLILSVRPGITDPATIALRNEADELAAAADPEAYYAAELLPRKTAVYVNYVLTRTLRRDLIILVRTVWAVVAQYR